MGNPSLRDPPAKAAPQSQPGHARRGAELLPFTRPASGARPSPALNSTGGPCQLLDESPKPCMVALLRAAARRVLLPQLAYPYEPARSGYAAGSCDCYRCWHRFHEFGRSMAFQDS